MPDRYKHERIERRKAAMVHILDGVEEGMESSEIYEHLPRKVRLAETVCGIGSAARQSKLFVDKGHGGPEAKRLWALADEVDPDDFPEVE